MFFISSSQEAAMKTLKGIIILVFVSLLLVTPSISLASQVYYQIIDLGLGHAKDINNQGQVLFNYDDQAYIWDESTGRVPIEGMRVGEAMNDLGYVVGISYDLDFVLWTPQDGLITIETRTDPYHYSRPSDINNRGQIVGTTHEGQNDYHAFLWSESTGMQDIGISRARAINDNGMVVGDDSFWTLEGGPQSLGYGADLVAARDVNDLGQVVGSADNFTSAPQFAFFWEDGTTTDDLGMYYAAGINNLGQVVGRKSFEDEPSKLGYACIWTEEDGLLMLDNTLLGGDPVPYWSLNPIKINDSGEIIAQVPYHVILLEPSDTIPLPRPVPIPGAVWLLGSGFLALAGLRKKLFQ
jgi:probable HAF family extracellular repeat protein